MIAESGGEWVRPENKGMKEFEDFVKILENGRAVRARLKVQTEQIVQAIKAGRVEAEAYQVIDSVRAVEEGHENHILSLVAILQALDGWQKNFDMLQPEIEIAERDGLELKPPFMDQLRAITSEGVELRARCESHGQNPAFMPVFEARGEVREKVGAILVTEQRAKLQIEKPTSKEALDGALAALSARSRAYLADYCERKSHEVSSGEDGGGAEREVELVEEGRETVERLLDLAEDLKDESMHGNFSGGDLVARQIFYFLAALKKGDYSEAVHSLDKYGSRVKPESVQNYEAVASGWKELLLNFQAYLEKPKPEEYTSDLTRWLGLKSEDFKAWQREGFQLGGENFYRIEQVVRVPESIRVNMNLGNMQIYLARCVDIHEKLAKVCRIFGTPGEPSFVRLREHLSRPKYAEVAFELRSEPKPVITGAVVGGRRRPVRGG